MLQFDYFFNKVGYLQAFRPETLLKRHSNTDAFL